MFQNPEVETWVEKFRMQLRSRIKREALDQQDVAQKINIPASTFSAQLNRTLKPWFVDRIAWLWPDEFESAPLEFRQAMIGVAGDQPSNLTHLRGLMLHFKEIERQAQEGIEAVEVVLRAAEENINEREGPEPNTPLPSGK